MNSDNMEFICYKKLVIFGAKGSGKTSFIRAIQDRKFEEDLESENGKYIIF